MIGKYKDMILEAVSLLKHVDEEDHVRTLEILIHQYDEHGDTYELLDSIQSDKFKKELTDIDLDTCTIENENLDRKPAAKVNPIKNTHVHDTSAGSVNVDPVVTVVGMIGREGSRDISGGSNTQEIIPGRKVITDGNIISKIIMDPRKIPPIGKEPLLGGMFLGYVISVVMMLPWVMTFLPGLISWVMLLLLIA